MTPGKQFENDFKASVPHTAFIYRFKDGTASWSSNQCPRCKSPIESATRFQAENICDFMLFNAPTLYFFELKSTQSKSLSYSSVRDNQVRELTVAGVKEGINAGFVVNFRTIEETYYMDIERYNECVKTLTSKSIPIAIFREYATRIDQEQKKVHYRYDIAKFLRDYVEPELKLF